MEKILEDRRIKINERMEIVKDKNLLKLKENQEAVFGRRSSDSPSEPLFKRVENEFQEKEKSKYEQRKEYLKSLRSLNVPLHSEQWRKEQKDHELKYL